MTSEEFANTVIIVSLISVVVVYLWFSRREGSYLNVLTPTFVIAVPAYFLLQLAYVDQFGTGYSSYAYLYVYTTLALKSAAFVWGYTRRREKISLPRFSWSNRHFGSISIICLVLAGIIFLPVLLKFQDYLSDPREIYRQTRTGFGHETFLSSMFAYLSIVFVVFSHRGLLSKTCVVALATSFMLLQGSKGQVVNVALLLLMYQVYVRGKQIRLVPALVRVMGVAVVVLGLFAMTMALGDSGAEALEAISQYSDYTRNAMMVIDSRFPVQYGRITMESNLYGLIPRVLMPTKPKNFGAFHLAEEFYPEWFDADTGSPDFGIGVQYADFGIFAVLVVASFSAFEGYLAHLFVNRLRENGNPADFLAVLYLAGVSIIAVGGAGWLFPEVLIVAMLVRHVSRIGVNGVPHPAHGVSIVPGV